MDQSQESKAAAAVLAGVLDSICGKLKRERGLTDEQIGLAMLATGLNSLSQAWAGRELVDHLAGITGAMMATHGIEPSGAVIARGRPN